MERFCSTLFYSILFYSILYLQLHFTHIYQEHIWTDLEKDTPKETKTANVKFNTAGCEDQDL